KQFDTVDIEDVSVADTAAHSEDTMQQREIRRAIMSLSIEYREPLTMQILMGFSGDEIAAQLNLNKNTVMTRLFRARNQLKEILTSQMNYGEQNNG
ncbi:MAG: RNA polymerase sigma-70 factor (ECF subfamily), partial [Glaciecola sp.]